MVGTDLAIPWLDNKMEPGKLMTQDPNEVVRRALESARRLGALADRSEAAALDDGCAVLCGIVRDCAYAIQGAAEKEMKRHQTQGVWPTDESGVGMPD